MEPVDPRIDPRLVPEGSRATLIAKDQPEYVTLPSIRTPLHQVITRWSLTDQERAAVLRGEDVYVTIMSAGAINPLFVTVGLVDWSQG